MGASWKKPVSMKICAIITLLSCFITLPTIAKSISTDKKTDKNNIEASKAQNQKPQTQAPKSQTTNPNSQTPNSEATKPLDNKTIEERLDTIEKTQEEMGAFIGSGNLVHTLFSKNFDLGGFILARYSNINGSDRSTNGINRIEAELIQNADLGDKFSIGASEEFELERPVTYLDGFGRRQPQFLNLESKATVDTAWINYAWKDKLEIQAGRYITPIGIINIQHFDPIFITPEKPLFLRPDEGGQTLFPDLLNGIQAHGKFFIGKLQRVLKYHLFAGNFTGTETRGGTPENIDYGARLSYAINEHLVMGANYLHGKRVLFTKSNYNLYGADLDANYKKLLFQSEYFTTEEQFGRNRQAYYFQPAVQVTPKWILFYRYDYLKNGEALSNVSGTEIWGLINSGRDDTENLLGFRYKPIDAIAIRLSVGLAHFAAGTVDGVNFRSANSVVTLLNFTAAI